MLFRIIDVLREPWLARGFIKHLLDRIPALVGAARIGLYVKKLGSRHYAAPVAKKRTTDRLLCCKQHVGDGAAPLDPASGCAADPSRIEAAGGGCETCPPPALWGALRAGFTKEARGFMASLTAMAPLICARRIGTRMTTPFIA